VNLSELFDIFEWFNFRNQSENSNLPHKHLIRANGRDALDSGHGCACALVDAGGDDGDG